MTTQRTDDGRHPIPSPHAAASGRTQPRSGEPDSQGGIGAPPCNTAPTNCIETDIRILRSGIDSLYLSIPGTLYQSAELRLEALKQAAQTEEYQSRAEAVYPLLDHQFLVSDKGSRRFRYVLTDYAYRIELSGHSSKRLPLAHVQIRSEYLTSMGIQACCDELTELMEYLGDTEDQLQVSRADLFCDFTSPLSLSQIDVDAFVTRAEYIPTHRVNRKITGYSFAPKCPLSGRLYDKTEELKKSGKEYLKPLWYEAGWHPEEPVQRLEFQFRRSTLKEHGIEGMDDLLCSLGSLWRYATLQWLKLTIPSEKDKTLSRWPLHPVWEILSQLEWDADQGGVSIPIREHSAPSDEYLFINGLSFISSFMAREGIADITIAFDEFHKRAQSFHSSREFFTGTDLNGYLTEKAVNKARKYGLPWPGIPEKAQARMDEAIARAYENEKQHRDRAWDDDDD